MLKFDHLHWTSIAIDHCNNNKPRLKPQHSLCNLLELNQFGCRNQRRLHRRNRAQSSPLVHRRHFPHQHALAHRLRRNTTGPQRKRVVKHALAVKAGAVRAERRQNRARPSVLIEQRKHSEKQRLVVLETKKLLLFFCFIVFSFCFFLVQK